MSITSKTDRFGIDIVIESLQQLSEPRLLAFWSNITIANYDSLPRANKNFRGLDKVPEISVDELEYKSVLLDDTLAVTSFWIVSDTRVFSDNTKQVKATISIIFQADLVKIYGQNNRADEEFNANILNVFKADNFFINSDLEIIQGIENVYSDLTFSEEINKSIQNDDMSRFHVVKFTMDVIYDPDCFPTLAAVCPPGGDPCSVTLNTDPLTDIPGGTSKAITIVDQDDNTVVVTTLIDTASIFKGKVDILTPYPGSDVYKTGQETSFRSFDDGAFEFGNGVSMFILSADNPAGNTIRFTGTTFTATIQADDVIIDWSTYNPFTDKVICYLMTPESGFPSTIMNAQTSAGFTRNSLTGWFVLNIDMLHALFYRELGTQLLDYSPFDHNVGVTADRIFTSTTRGATTWLAYTGGFNYGQVSDISQATFLFRRFTLTELGL